MPVTAREAGGYGAAPGASGAPQDGESAFAVLDDRLRGRWRIAIVLGLLLGVSAAAAGFLLSPILYTSQGIAQVHSEGDMIIFQTEDNQAIRQFDSTMRTAAFFVTSDEVIMRAIERLRRPVDPATPVPALVNLDDAIDRIRDRLSVRVERGSEILAVSFDDEEPRTAALVVNAVLLSFEEQQEASFKDHLRTLELVRSTQSRLMGERDAIMREREAFLDASKWQGAEGLVDSHYATLSEQKFELNNLELQLSAVRAREANADPDAESEPMITDWDIEELAATDPNLALRLGAVDAKRAEIQGIEEKWREGPLRDHQLDNARRELALLESQLQQQIAIARQLMSRRVAREGVGPTGIPMMSGEELERAIAARRALIEQMQIEGAAMRGELTRLEAYETRLEDKLEELDRVNTRLQMLESEKDPQFFAGAVDITEASTPRRPSKDRRKPMAAIGFMGGMGLSLGFFFLLGTLDQKTFRSRQFRPQVLGARCLGVLPDLGQRTDAEVSQMATQCVHQIRNRIEAARAMTETGYALMVSGPFQGDGKTSLTMSLAWSYANAGYRTVVVDADLVGRGLSHHLRVTAQPGLREALRSRHVNGEVTAVPSVENLFVLPAGQDPTFGPESIRRDAFSTLCAELREQFEIILVDTGPFVGSIEILPVASSVDGAVLAVQRGRSRAPLKSCIDELAEMRVPCLGVVLNQADRSDCSSYVSASVLSQRTLEAMEGEPEAGASNAVVRAMKPERGGARTSDGAEA